MEMEKVPQAGYEIKGLWISGIQRKLTLKNLSFPFKLLSSLWKANRIINKFKPDIAIGTGGFASGPTLMMASRKGVPTLIQEQNSFPGITNKLLSKKANKICVAYDHLERFFPIDKIIKTGNPVRQDLLSIHHKTQEANKFFSLEKNKTTILILGGSLGARRINQLIEDKLSFFKEQEVQLVWQCGKLYFDEYQKYNQVENVQVHQFVNRMDLAYAAADVIISRAGASSVSELCIVGKPTVFIPSPNVAEDHQTKNAQSIANKHGAILIKESELETFPIVFETLLKDKGKRQSLSENIKALALPNATTHIVNEIEKLIQK
jgi:UDP-N-acetylglucosamine--N-acetylmuramyl-(pentapeptide) pyrophosphoryl-undecaprenol N-acetylglucosamine transferase